MNPSEDKTPCVAAAIATHRRDKELARLLDCLERSGVPLDGGVFVADNAASRETEATCRRSPVCRAWLPQPANNGPGPAWNAAITRAMQQPDVTHVLVLDDDVVPPPDTLGLLLDAMMSSNAGAAAPLLFDAGNSLWGFPEPREGVLRSAIRRLCSPEECLGALGGQPHAFCWATGACMLYSRRAFTECGLFREDFWMLGEDLDLSMRVAAALGGVFTARATVPHLPPPPDPATERTSHRLKFLALLQNLSFLAYHSPHSGHLRRYLAGNFKRYLRTEGIAPGTAWDAWGAFLAGALRKQPAGTPAGERIRRHALKRLAKDRPE